MIILITGVPGSGKTLYAVSKFLNGQFADRQKYVNAIPRLLLPHEVLSGEEEMPRPDADVLNWFDGRVPDGSLIVIDEAQRVFRPRSSTAPVPRHVSALETHRHHGLDFILITQHPQLIDVNVRRLVGRHLHVRRTFGFGSAFVYEWDSAHMDVTNVGKATKSIFRYKKKDFALYKSAEVHTKASGKVPGIIKVFGLALLLLPLALYYGYKTVVKPEETGGEAVTTSVQLPPAIAADSASPVPLTAGQLAATYKPRFDGVVHTAPRYDELTKPVRVPVPAACVASNKRGCKCYTQDGSPYPTTDSLCRQYVAGGYFQDFPVEGQHSADNGQGQQGLPVAQKVAYGTAAPAPDLPESHGASVIEIPYTPTPLAPRVSLADK